MGHVRAGRVQCMPWAGPSTDGSPRASTGDMARTYRSVRFRRLEKAEAAIDVMGLSKNDLLIVTNTTGVTKHDEGRRPHCQTCRWKSKQGVETRTRTMW